MPLKSLPAKEESVVDITPENGMNPLTTGQKVQRCIIITGMSGGGKSTALHMLEDRGMYAIDNIPPALLPQLLSVLSRHEGAVQSGVAAVVDVRGNRLLRDLFSVIDLLRKKSIAVTVLFLDASDSILLQRFEKTRRRHPLASDASILEAIGMERVEMSPVLEWADCIIDTTDMDLAQLRGKLGEELDVSPGTPMVLFTSFGFKYGIPPDGDYVFDVRFLPNPYYVPELRPLSGKSEKVQDFMDSFTETGEFLFKVMNLLEFVFPLYANTAKHQMQIAIGCTGGRHRSVALTEKLARDFTAGMCMIRHRDVDKEQVWSS
jgi:UPF0042 nucleotide-binding protein